MKLIGGSLLTLSYCLFAYHFAVKNSSKCDRIILRKWHKNFENQLTNKNFTATSNLDQLQAFSIVKIEPRREKTGLRGFPTRSYTNRAAQLRNEARDLKFQIKEVEGLYYPCSENKGADQLRGYREADLRLCFRICKNPVFSRRGSINYIPGKNETYYFLFQMMRTSTKVWLIEVQVLEQSLWIC